MVGFPRSTDASRTAIYGIGTTPAKAGNWAREEFNSPTSVYVIMEATERLYNSVLVNGGDPSDSPWHDDGPRTLVLGDDPGADTDATFYLADLDRE